MTNATTTTSTTNATAMGNGNKKAHATSLSADDLHKYSTKPTTKDVSKWSSLEVQHWIRHQCKKFELHKAITEQFEMNGQALMLLTKHDFLRRAPNGGEVLYYALQRLINPNKQTNSVGNNANTFNGESSTQQSRIVEVNNDQDTVYDTTDSSSTKPIIEEPDDPPLLRKSQSATNHDADQHDQHDHHNHRYFYSQGHFRPTVFAMPAGGAVAYFQQPQRLPNGFVYAPPPPHHPMHPPPFIHPHLLPQYYPMMSAQEILVEIMDDAEPDAFISNGPMDGGAADSGLFMVTISGQRYIMNEAQVMQLVGEVYQQQGHQGNQQQQFQQQQQQQFRQHQQYMRQQQQQRGYPQQYHFQQQ